MNNEEKMTFTIKDDTGKEVVYDILFSFESEDTGCTYIVYTDNTVDENGSTMLYASRYEAVGDEENALYPIETQEEWSIIENILDDLRNECIANEDDEGLLEE